jgi:hypothetical protein
MSTIMKCPNPSCPYRFDAALVPPGAVIACPQCRSQFTLGGQPVSQAPQRLPTAAAPTVQNGFPTRSSKPDLIGRQAVSAKSNLSVMLAVLSVGVFALLGGGIAFVGYALGWFQKTVPTSDHAAVKFEEYAVSIGKPADGWGKDEATRSALGVNLIAFKKGESEAWLAVDAQKFGTTARANDLRTRILERLQKQFEELDVEVKPQPSTVLGQPGGERYSFDGVYQTAGVGCHGEVHCCIQNNYAYWIYTWAPARSYQQHAVAFQQFRDGVKSISGGKTTFVAPKRSDKSYRSKSGLFTVTDSDGLWVEKTDPTSQDQAAELWLKGTGKSIANGQTTSEKADLIVAVIEPMGEAKAQALTHVVKQFVNGATVDELPGPMGEASATANQVTRLKLTYSDGPTANKLIAFTTIDVADKRVIAYATCSLKELNYWEQRLSTIAGSLKAGK